MKKLTLKAIRKINDEYRQKDESYLWPICNEYNLTERSIRKLRQLRSKGLEVSSVYEYKAALEHIMSEYVNYGKVR